MEIKDIFEGDFAITVSIPEYYAKDRYSVDIISADDAQELFSGYITGEGQKYKLSIDQLSRDDKMYDLVTAIGKLVEISESIVDTRGGSSLSIDTDKSTRELLKEAFKKDKITKYEINGKGEIRTKKNARLSSSYTSQISGIIPEDDTWKLN